MSLRIKNVLVSVLFFAFIGFFFVFSIIKPQADRSVAERRPLAQFPSVSVSEISSGRFSAGFEDYAVDQFPLRDTFRSVKAYFQYTALGMSENNSLALHDGYIIKVGDKLSEKSVDNAVSKIRGIYERYLTNSQVYLSIVPDKGYFASEMGYPTPDYNKLIDMMCDGLGEIEYIDITGELSLADYYRTDTHWRQECLGGVLERLGSEMGFYSKISGSYAVESHEGYYGVYYGQSALKLPGDTVRYLRNDTIDALRLYDYEKMKTSGVYSVENLLGDDSYEVFLGGFNKGLLRVDNPNADTERELVVFRDSFGSAIVPLIAEAYKTVYVVDIRYIMPYIACNMIDFDGKDVLFLFSTLVLSDSSEFK